MDKVIDTCPTITTDEVQQVASILANLELWLAEEDPFACPHTKLPLEWTIGLDAHVLPGAG